MLSNFPLAPPSASNFAFEYDVLFYGLLALTILFTAIVCIGLIYFTIKYRKGSDADRYRPVYEDGRLEAVWSVGPLILAIVFFFLGAKQFIHMRTPPQDAQEIYVIGKQWMWHIQHSNGVRENNTLHVPLGKPVKLTMISQDVIHAFYIPAFRVQMHVVPGRYTSLWFTPTKKGEYHLFCTMYCGTQHSEMGGKVIVMEPKEWAEWIDNGGETRPSMTMAQAGMKLFNRVGCNNCHGPESNIRAPSLVNLFGSTRAMANGPSVVADEAYIRESILRPHTRISQGYGESMPAYDGQLSEREIIELLAYIKTMGSGIPVAPPGSPAGPGALPAQAQGTSQTPMAAGAIQYQTERPDITPTTRQGRPAVGAVAAQQEAVGN